MNFQQLEYVVAVHDHKVFSAAAYSCKVSQATLSAMIIKLEKEVGFEIFNRKVKPVATTELGQKLVDEARNIISQKNMLLEMGKSEPTSISGELALGVIPTVANSLLPRIIPTLMEENPELSLKVNEVTTDEIIRKLKTGDLEVGIAATPLNDNDIDEEILYYEPMLVYGVAEGNKEFVVDDDLMSGKLWLLEEEHCFRQQVVTLCGLRKKESELKNLLFEGNSFETLLSMVDTFGGYTLIPELYYQNMRENRQTKTRIFQKPIPVREISIVSLASAKKTLTIKHLSKLIQKTIVPELSTSKFKNKDLRIIGIN